MSNPSGSGVLVGYPATAVISAGSVIGVTGISIQGVGSVDVLTNNGAISGSGGYGVNDHGISNAGVIRQLTNSGAINGIFGGIFGDSYGISNSGAINQLTNSGAISGSGNRGLVTSDYGISIPARSTS